MGYSCVYQLHTRRCCPPILNSKTDSLGLSDECIGLHGNMAYGWQRHISTVGLEIHCNVQLFCVYSFGYFPGVRLCFADVSERSVRSIFNGSMWSLKLFYLTTTISNRTGRAFSQAQHVMIILYNCRYTLLLSNMFRLVIESSSGCWNSRLLTIKCYPCFNL
jgi:hypothetical protein